MKKGRANQRKYECVLIISYVFFYFSQEMKVQEQVSNLCLGTIPRSVWVTLEDDLVDVCKPGDDVLVIGTGFFFILVVFISKFKFIKIDLE